MKFTPTQDLALLKVDKWFREDSSAQQVYRLFGYAGSGKTTLAKHFAEGIMGTVLFSAFTGKAAHVMAQKGCVGARTIHSLIYTPKSNSKNRLNNLMMELDHLKAQPEPDYDVIHNVEEEIKREKENAGRMSFSLNLTSDLKQAKLLIIDECFVRGTLINTPNGLIPIEHIRNGDEILNAYGTDKVTRISKKEATKCAKIKAGGKEITCSEDHRFFTERGEVRARDLRLGERFASLSESVRLLQFGVSSKGSGDEKILYDSLLNTLVAKLPRIQAKSIHKRPCQKIWREKKKILKLWFQRSFITNRKNSKFESGERSSCGKENKHQTQIERQHIQNSWWKWNWSNKTSINVVEYFRNRLEIGIYCQHKLSWGRISSSLQARSSAFSKKALYRSRWKLPYAEQNTTKRFEEDKISREFRMESIEILESGDSRLDKFRDEEGKLYLYDLTAERHSSFAVEGILVHNCSMVDFNMGKDLESFGVPILVLGDPEQLPPVYGTGYFTEQHPDTMLEEIHRQALDNPIISMSKMVREGKSLDLGNYGESKVVTSKLTAGEILNHDIILTGLRRTKKACDEKYRQVLERADKPLPVAGDRLMCVKNNHQMGLLNGQIWRAVSDAIPLGDGTVSLHLMDPESEIEVAVSASEKLLRGIPLDRWEHDESVEEFEYAYAITVHKSQGSQWDSVLLFDQKDRFPNWSAQNRRRWLYTGITRAAERITVMRL